MPCSNAHGPRLNRHRRETGMSHGQGRTSVRVFFDTEFTDLTGGQLISIGMVDETGTHEFYAEVADTWLPSQCSAFCLREVLPHLQGAPYRRPLQRVRACLHAWLSARGPRVTLVCDAAADVVQLQQLFPDGLPAGVTVKVLGFWSGWRRRLLNAGRRVSRRHGLRVHHALDDARVNRLVLTRWFGS